MYTVFIKIANNINPPLLYQHMQVVVTHMLEREH